MTKKDFYKNIVCKSKEQLIQEKEGVYLHLKHLFEANNSKAIFQITGLDFSEMFYFEKFKARRYD